jgi:hypothetical protein
MSERKGGRVPGEIDGKSICLLCPEIVGKKRGIPHSEANLPTFRAVFPGVRFEKEDRTCKSCTDRVYKHFEQKKKFETEERTWREKLAHRFEVSQTERPEALLQRTPETKETQIPGHGIHPQAPCPPSPTLDAVQQTMDQTIRRLNTHVTPVRCVVFLLVRLFLEIMKPSG